MKPTYDELRAEVDRLTRERDEARVERDTARALLYGLQNAVQARP